MTINQLPLILCLYYTASLMASDDGKPPRKKHRVAPIHISTVEIDRPSSLIYQTFSVVENRIKLGKLTFPKVSFNYTHPIGFGSYSTVFIGKMKETLTEEKIIAVKSSSLSPFSFNVFPV